MQGLFTIHIYVGLNLSFVACLRFKIGLLVVKLILYTCILVLNTCTTTPTGHFTLCTGF